MLLQVLITIGASQALALAILILLKRQPAQADYLLSIKLFLVFLITLLYNYHDELEVVAPALPLNSFVLGYLVLPVFYLYIKSASGREVNIFEGKHLAHLLPFLWANFILIFFFYPLPYEEKQLLFDQMLWNEKPLWFSLLYHMLFLGMFPFYLMKCFVFLKKYEDDILTKFSYTEDISLEWLSRFLWGMVIVGATFILFEVVAANFFNFSSKEGMLLPFITLLGLVFYLGIYGLRHKIIFFDEPEPVLENRQLPTSSDAKYQYSNLTSEKGEEYLAQLLQFMKTEKPYLQPKISIGELSEKADIPVHYLSQIINEKLNQNFFDFINSYRVEEFKQLLAMPDNQNYTLLSLAFEAGFNSKSSFNAIFKKITGLTPSGFARRNSAQQALHTISDSK